jgi:Secretion system C-terminal sorting domain
MGTILHLRNTLSAALLVLGTALSAQTITAYRYWFDDDGANTTTTVVAGGQQYTLNSVDASTLGKGYHRITLQFRDSNNAWGVPVTTNFYRNGGNLTAYRYWFDDDPSTAVGVNLTPGLTANINASLDASALSLGHHRVTFRTRDGLSNWSAPQTSVFARMGGQETAWQYWFDDNVSTLVETAVGPTDLVNVATQIDANALNNGAHTITLRTKDAQSGFSVPITYSFDVVTAIEELAGVERMLLFPNPATDRIALRMDANRPQDLTVSVVDATGRAVLAPERFAFSGLVLREFDLNALASGSYSLLVSNGPGQQRIAFLKQ